MIQGILVLAKSAKLSFSRLYIFLPRLKKILGEWGWREEVKEVSLASLPLHCKGPGHFKKGDIFRSNAWVKWWLVGFNFKLKFCLWRTLLQIKLLIIKIMPPPPYNTLFAPLPGMLLNITKQKGQAVPETVKSFIQDEYNKITLCIYKNGKHYILKQQFSIWN